MEKTYLSFLLLVFVFSASAFGYLVEGTIVDEHGEPVPAAHIYIPTQNIGASADLDGKYLLSIPQKRSSSEQREYGAIHFQISAVGYSQRDTFIVVISDTTLNIVLLSQALVAEPVVVSASRVEQRLMDSPMSTSVEPGDAITMRVVGGLDDAMKYLSGVTMNKYQLSVRNSSGYSHGAGSRVAMLIDGVPVLAGDTGEIKWDAMPTSAINQVEIVKGAGSSLYGSGALGGTVNIITATPRGRTLKIWSKLGAYDKPHWDEWRWTDKLQTIKGIGVQWGNKLRSVAYTASAEFQQNDSYREASDYLRSKCFAKLHWDISQNRSLSAFVNAAYEDRGNFFEWKSQSSALEVVDGCENDRVWSSKLFSAVTYRGDAPKRHLFFNVKLYNIFNNWDSRIFNTDSLQYESENSMSAKIGADAQVMFTWQKQFFTIGSEASFNINRSKTFGDHIGTGGAVFAQDELSYLHPLVLTIGARLDAFWVDSATTDYFFGASPKIAAVYHITEYSAARLSVSSGFRIPTMSELFTRTNAGGIFLVEPNPDLKPEQGYTSEIGINYIRNGFLLDGAVFYNFYSDMIEPVQQEQFNRVRFINRRQVQIYGTELSAKWSWRQWSISANYMYTSSLDLDTNEKLPYRPDNSFTISGSWDLWKHLELSADWRTKSEVEYGYYTADVKVPQRVLDVQARLHFKLGTLTFRVNNVFNYNYIEIERNLAPIRHFILTAQVNVY